MALVVDTAQVAREERFTAWRDCAAQLFEPIKVETRESGGFLGRAEAHPLGSLQLLRMSSDRSLITRDAAMIRRSDPEWIQVMLQTGGRHTVTQDDRSTPVTAGDIVAWRSTSPYQIAVEAPWSGLILVCPLALLASHSDRVSRQTALRFDSSNGPGLVLGQFLRGVWTALEDGSLRGSEPQLGAAALELIRAVYVRPEPDEGDRSAALRARALEHIEVNLGEPSLSAPVIAAALYLSRSQLDRAFQAGGVTVSQWIRQRRLEHCRRDLLDPGRAHEPISTIASRWGFVSQAHFSRAFRAAYGTSPRELRQTAIRSCRWRRSGNS